MKKYLIVLITFFTLHSCIQERTATKEDCQLFTILTLNVNNSSKASEEGKQQSVNMALTACLLSYFSNKYEKPTPPFERNQDGY